MKITVFMIVILTLTGCASGSKSGGFGIAAGTVSGSSSSSKVFINKNSWMTTMDTYEIALDHCLKFGKTPRLFRQASAFDLWLQDEYNCIIR